MYVAGGAVWARAGAAGHSTRITSKTIRIRLWTVITSRVRPCEFSFIVVPSAGLPNNLLSDKDARYPISLDIAPNAGEELSLPGSVIQVMLQPWLSCNGR